MFGKAVTVAVALTAGLVALPAPVAAQPLGYEGNRATVQLVQGRRGRDDRRWEDRRDGRRGDWDRRGYGRRDYDDRRDYGRRGRCRDKGTGGTILGAIAGGLLGDAAVGRRGDGTAGAIVGAGVGALAGRAIDRDC